MAQLELSTAARNSAISGPIGLAAIAGAARRVLASIRAPVANTAAANAPANSGSRIVSSSKAAEPSAPTPSSSRPSIAAGRRGAPGSAGSMSEMDAMYPSHLIQTRVVVNRLTRYGRAGPAPDTATGPRPAGTPGTMDQDCARLPPAARKANGGPSAAVAEDSVRDSCAARP